MDDQQLIPRPERTVQRFDRLKHRRNTMLHLFLEYRNKSAGAVASGRVLNLFLELCGPTAFAHHFYRGSKPLDPAQQQLEEKVFMGLTDEHRLSFDVVHSIRYKRGLTGARITGRIGSDPLDTTWPTILQGPKHQVQIQRIESLRTETLAALRMQQPASAETANDLVDAVIDLLNTVQREMGKAAGNIRDGYNKEQSNADWFQYRAAEKHLRLFLTGVYALIEAQSIEDVTDSLLITVQKNGGKVKEPLDRPDGVSIEELLAYMHEHNLYFVEADANGQNAYKEIFDMMSRYYVDLYLLKTDTDDDESRIAAMRAEEQKLQDIKYGITLDNFEKTAIAIEAIDEIGDAIESINTNKDGG